uniref:Putative secreted protein n=1 Tax=Amblyomma cajennense TaxID=34607 RepID=A0A023FBJ6_AMBCJ
MQLGLALARFLLFFCLFLFLLLSLQCRARLLLGAPDSDDACSLYPPRSMNQLAQFSTLKISYLGRGVDCISLKSAPAVELQQVRYERKSLAKDSVVLI